MFTFFFPVWMPFISYCVVAAARTCSTMLNKSGENRHSCLFSDLRGNTFSFCPFSMILAIGFSYVVFIMLRYDPSILTLLRVFIINRCWILSNASSASIDRSCDFYLSFCLCEVLNLLTCEYHTNLASWNMFNVYNPRNCK